MPTRPRRLLAQPFELRLGITAADPVKEDVIGERHRLDHIERAMDNAQLVVPTHKLLGLAQVIGKESIRQKMGPPSTTVVLPLITYSCNAAVAGTILNVEPGG